MAGMFSPVRPLRMKNSFEDQGLAISSMLAITGALSVACGTSVLGSGAGEGTSICGCCPARSQEDDDKDHYEPDYEFESGAGGVGGTRTRRGNAGDLRHLGLEAVRWGLTGHKASYLLILEIAGGFKKQGGDLGGIARRKEV